MKKLTAAIATSLVLATLAGCSTPTTATMSGSGQATVGGNRPAASNPATAGGNVQTGANVQTGNATPTVTKLPVAQAQAGATISQETAAALAEERDLADYDALIDAEGGASKYALMAGGFGATVTAMAKVNLFGGVVRANAKLDKADAKTLRAEAKKLDAKIDGFKAKRDEMKKEAAKLKVEATVKARIESRLVAHRGKIAKRLDKLADVRTKIRSQLETAAWVDNGDGTKTKTVTFDVTKTVNGKSHVRKATLVRTANADGVIIAASGDFEQELPGGLKRVSSRTRTLQADGSYAVVFHAVITLPGGASRVAHWEKTISADGVVTGTGVLQWFAKDGALKKTVTIALGGSDEAPEASCEDETADTTAEVTLTEDGAVEAVVETENGTTTDVEVGVSTDGSVDVVTTEEGTASLGADGQVSVDASVAAAAGAGE